MRKIDNVKFRSATSFEDAIKMCPDTFDQKLTDMLLKIFWVTQEYHKISCSISGGYDSDILLDAMERFGGRGKTTYVFNDTGLEYDATKRHLQYLVAKYHIHLTTLQPQKPIPACVKTFGVPFWGKYVSQMLSRLQKHGFQWEDEPFKILYERYPHNKSSLRFWCNDFKTENGRESKFNIAYVRGLKEFILRYPPDFLISAKCCDYAKKNPTHAFVKKGEFDLNCTGVRKAEGGIRATAYSSCYEKVLGSTDEFRPLFWMTDAQKELYRKHFGILRSDCYEIWGMKRTGCVGCPFGKEFEAELLIAKEYEPKRYAAMLAIFGKSYDYTRRFLEFRKKHTERRSEPPCQ